MIKNLIKKLAAAAPPVRVYTFQAITSDPGGKILITAMARSASGAQQRILTKFEESGQRLETRLISLKLVNDADSVQVQQTEDVLVLMPNGKIHTI